MEIRTPVATAETRTHSALVGCLGLLPAMDMADVMNGSLAACDSAHPSHADLVLLAAATSMVQYLSNVLVACGQSQHGHVKFGVWALRQK